MKQLGLVKADFVLLLWPGIFSALALLVAAGIYGGMDYFDKRANQQLQAARQSYQNIADSIDTLGREERVIGQYIDRYNALSDQGILADEDRLELFETIASVRKANNLFPVSVGLEEQKEILLSYSPDTANPGDPVALRSSRILLTLPLLHEEDLARLIDGLMSSPGLYQTERCLIVQKAMQTLGFREMEENLAAECSIHWYTFNLKPEPAEEYY